MSIQKDHVGQKSLQEWIWVLPVIVPLSLIFFSYIFMPWSWGLMDDLQLLGPGSIWQRTRDMFMMYFAFGECKWTHALHCAVFYKIFANTPELFHIFKWAEITVMLLIWGAAAYQLTGRLATLFLVPSIALSFHYLYDQFFFLSTHETTGLLFFGLAVLCIIRALFGKAHPWLWIAAGFCLLLSLGAKETFVACGFGLGLSMVALSVISRPSKRWHLWGGLLLAALFVLYGLILKKFVSTAYTAHYNFFDLRVILLNFKVWIAKDLLNHMPWIAAIAFLWFIAKKKNVKYTVVEIWGMLLGALLYLGFLLVLLPWNTKSYYAGPFGVFFAFTAAIVLASLLDKVRVRWSFILVVFALVFNLFVAQYAWTREAMYHQNTQDLWSWMKGNKEFQEASRLGQVACIGMEAAMALPGHANRQWGLGLLGFHYQIDIKKALQENIKYFLYSPRFGGPVDASGWTTVFYSQYWQVYEKEAK